MNYEAVSTIIAKTGFGFSKFFFVLSGFFYKEKIKKLKKTN